MERRAAGERASAAEAAAAAEATKSRCCRCFMFLHRKINNKEHNSVFENRITFDRIAKELKRDGEVERREEEKGERALRRRRQREHAAARVLFVFAAHRIIIQFENWELSHFESYCERFDKSEREKEKEKERREEFERAWRRRRWRRQQRKRAAASAFRTELYRISITFDTRIAKGIESERWGKKYISTLCPLRSTTRRRAVFCLFSPQINRKKISI